MKRKGLLGAILIFAVAVWGCVSLYHSQNAVVLEWKNSIKIAVNNLQLPSIEQEEKGLTGAITETAYLNGEITDKRVPAAGQDGKKVLHWEKGSRLVDYANGFLADFSADAQFDFSRSALWVQVIEGDLTIKISREYSTEPDSREYCKWYFDRFMTDPVHLEENGLFLTHEPEDGAGGSYWFSVGGQEQYAYAFVPTNSRIFYRILFRYPEDSPAIEQRMDQLLNSFRWFKPEGKATYTKQHHLQIPQEWSEETKEVFQSILDTDSIYWGIFADQMLTRGTDTIIPQLEEKLGYDFPVVLYYLPYGDAFPVEFMEQNYQKGKVVELTCQLSGYSNEKLYGFTPQLAAYRGLEDETIREMAWGAKKFGHPFLFRLNNEMNSDWTNYSGVTVLEDPDIYVEVWRRFYRIFQEEGVTNAIWIFNPNDRDYPPANWNHFMAYYPGDEYVQLIGITGYNTGTYYKETKNETWREFREIYDRLEDRMQPYFLEFPWMITEFSSSSIGGDKARWMRRMFDQIGEYPNIKLAVWFHFADFDPEHPQTVARPYWLDETEETLDAAKKGLKNRPKWPFESQRR